MIKSLPDQAINKTAFVMILFFSIFLFSGVYLNTPLPMGESDDYLISTITLPNRLSLYITPEDIEQAKKDFPTFSNYIAQQYEIGGFFHTNDVKAHSWYMGTYSALCIPAKFLLKTLGLPQIYAFGITNALLYAISLFVVFFRLNKPKPIVLLTLLLLMLNPAVFYVTWISSEVFVFSFIVISLVFFINQNYKLAGLFVSIAGSINATIMVYGAMIIVDYFINLFRKNSVKDMNALIKVIQNNWINILKLAVCFFPCLVTFAYNYIHFGSFNLQMLYGDYADFYDLPGRFWAYLFDLNLGILPYFLIGFVLFVILTLYGVVKKNYRSVLFIIACFGVVAAYSIMTNINCAMTGIARYSIWIIPMMVFYLTCLGIEIVQKTFTRQAIYALLSLSALYTCVILAYYGPFFPNRTSDAHLTPIARFVLDQAPYLYIHPFPPTFHGRVTSLPKYHGIQAPILYVNKDGYARKMYVEAQKAEELQQYFIGERERDNQYLAQKIERLKHKKGFVYLSFGKSSRIKVRDSYLSSTFPYLLPLLNIGNNLKIYPEFLNHNEFAEILDQNLILHPGGIQFGPYGYIEKGFYTVRIVGSGLERLRYDAAYNGGKNLVEITEQSKSDNEILYRFHITENTSNMEFRCINESNLDVQISYIETTIAIPENIDSSEGSKAPEGAPVF